MNACATTIDTTASLEKSLRVMLVDDEQDILDSVRDMLELQFDDIAVETAGNITAAHKLADEFVPDLALIDIKLNQDNGLDMVPFLKSRHPDMICIMMTAFRDTDYAIKALRIGADDYLLKPIEPEMLFKLIDKYSERQRLMREKAEADRRFHAVFDQSFDMFFLLDTSGHLVDINHTAETFTGYTKSAIVGKHFSKALAWDTSTRFTDRLHTMLNNATRGDKARGELLLHDNDGSQRTIDFSITPIIAEQNQTTMLCVEGRDITMRKLAEDALRNLNQTLEQRILERTRELEASRNEAQRASNAKSEFLSRMSHELRTPLNLILGFSQLLQLDEEHLLNDEQQDWLNEIRSAGNHLLELVDDVLDITRIEHNNLQVNNQPTQVDIVISESLNMVQILATKHGVSVAMPDAPFDDVISADKTRLKQVMVNLLSNAVKYNNKGGRVWLEATRLQDRLRISVCDNGPGISRDDQERLFNPFERLDNDRVDGMGIGLTICKQLVGLMHGKIGVISEPGQGACFWVELPLYAG